MKECLKHFSLRPPIGLVLKTLPQTIVGCRLDRAHEGVPKDTKWTIRYDRWLASPATSIQLRLQVTVKQRAGDRLAAYCTTFWCRSKHCTDRHHAMKFGNYRGTNILTSGGDAFKNFWGDFVFLLFCSSTVSLSSLQPKPFLYRLRMACRTGPNPSLNSLGAHALTALFGPPIAHCSHTTGGSNGFCIGTTCGRTRHIRGTTSLQNFGA